MKKIKEIKPSNGTGETKIDNEKQTEIIIE